MPRRRAAAAGLVELSREGAAPAGPLSEVERRCAAPSWTRSGGEDRREAAGTGSALAGCVVEDRSIPRWRGAGALHWRFACPAASAGLLCCCEQQGSGVATLARSGAGARDRRQLHAPSRSEARRAGVCHQGLICRREADGPGVPRHGPPGPRRQSRAGACPKFEWQLRKALANLAIQSRI
jgi:hypothetical protein